MGEIFLAARAGPLGFGPPVALKVLREELATDESFIGMLVDEANISRFLNHQNVVSVLDFGEHSGNYFIAMEFVQGITLQALMDGLRDSGRRMETPLALYVATELCRALKYAHTRRNHAGEPLNIIHRDVTPGNLLLSIQGEVKLTDFGIARARGRSQKTQAGVLKGKFGYMAPEMVRYEEIDARADIFCAGVVIYEMVAGRHPVQGCSIIDAIENFEEKNIDTPSKHNPSIPKALDIILMRALEPNPDARWASAAALGTALQDLALQSEASRRDIGGGATHLSAVIRDLSPDSFGPAIPKDLAERLLAQARSRESGAPTAGPAPSPVPHSPSPVPQAPSLVLQAPSVSRSQPEPEAPTPQMAADGRGHLQAPSASFQIRPTVGQAPSTPPGREVAELPTAQALQALDDDEDGPTIIPGIGGVSLSVADLRTQEGLHPVEDPSGGFADGLQLDANAASTVNVAADSPNSLRGPSAVSTVNLDGLEDPPKSNGRTHDTSTDREQPAVALDPESADATIPVGAISKEELDAFIRDAASSIEVEPDPAAGTLAESNAQDDDGDSDDKTVAMGMAVPDWGGTEEDLGAARVATEEDTSHDRPLFEEIELAGSPSGSPPPAYDDDATAFSAQPAAFADDPDDLDQPTFIPEISEFVDPQPVGGDATLLDQVTAEDVERAKRQYQEGRLSLDGSPPPIQEEEEEATRIRPEAELALAAAAGAQTGTSPAVDAINPGARQLTGPLRIKVGTDGKAALASDPHALSPDEDHTDATLEAPPRKVVGKDPNKWVPGQAAPDALSWSDEDAARRAVDTRNSTAGQAPPPGVPNAPAPAPMGLGGPPIAAPPMPTPLSPSAAVAQTCIPGQLPAAPDGPPPHLMPQPAPLAQPLPLQAISAPGQVVPQPGQSTAQAAPRKRSSLLLAVAVTLIALFTGGIFMLSTDALWATLTLNTVPPGATVVLDGKVLHVKTPVSVSVKPHVEHIIEFQLTGYPTKRLDDPIKVGFRQSLDISVPFAQPERVVSITPVSGRVFVNDTQVGLGTRVELPRLDITGKVKLHVEATGYETWSHSFDSPEQVPTAIDVALRKK